MRHSRKGFTFLEILIVALIFFVAVFTLAALYASCLTLLSQAKEIDIVTNDIKNVMENIKGLPFSSIMTNFPDGASVPGAYLLRNETLIVSYPSVTPELLEIQVEAHWLGRDNNEHQQTFKTIVYKGL